MGLQGGPSAIEESMGYNIVLLEQRFVIRKERKVAALSAVKLAMREGITIPSAGSGSPFPFRFEHEREMLSARSLEGLLRVCGFYPQVRAGDIVGLELDSETEYTQQEQLFVLLGPYVEPGYLEFTNDDDTVVPDRWRDNFTGTRHERVYPELRWPPYTPRPVAHPALLYRLSPGQRQAFAEARRQAGNPAFVCDERAGVTLLDCADSALGEDDAAFLDALAGRIAGLRVTFPDGALAPDREAVAGEFRSRGCDVWATDDGFLAALPPLVELPQYRWWMSWYAERAPQEGEPGSLA